LGKSRTYNTGLGTTQIEDDEEKRGNQMGLSLTTYHGSDIGRGSVYFDLGADMYHLGGRPHGRRKANHAKKLCPQPLDG
jgi:hypothetical protein